MGRLFGTDGVRGIAGKELTAEFAMNLGIATAYVLTKSKKGGKVVIGKDTRISGDMLVSSLIAGLTSVGLDVIDLGVVPTPCVSLLVSKYKALAGIMVSASHNPSEYNGIKIFDKNGYKLPDALEDEIEDTIINIDKYNFKNNNIGRLITGYDPIGDYVNHLKKACDTNMAGLNVIVDCANGSASMVAPRLFSELDCNATVINATPDGYNINHNCGSTHIENLVSKVLENNLDCGIAYDGDADRCIMVDNKGNVIDGDYILAITSNYLKENNKLSKNTVVGTVMSNLGFVKFCQDYKINFEKTKVGDRYVLEEMLLKGYNLGGEQSGHIIFKDYANTGDGELTSLKVLEVMRYTKKSLNELSSIMTKYPQVLINVEVDNSKKNEIYNDDDINEEIKRISNILDQEGRVLVRPSGTEALIRVMIEGADTKVIEKYAQDIANKIKEKLN